MTFHKTIKQQHFEIFIEDLKLMGFNTKEAKRELDLLKTCKEEIDYIKASRIGFIVRLNRKQRKEIFDTYETWIKE